MKAWVFLCNDSPLEHWMQGYQERFDAWEDGGVTGLVVGRMLFRQPDGSGLRGYAPDPKIYAEHGEQPPAFPQTQGIIIDGPGEHSYELAFHHGGEVFEVSEGNAARFDQLGVDVDRARRGMRHLRDRLHELTPDRVRFHAGGGMLAALQLFDFNEDALYWLRARQMASRCDWQWAREQADAADGKVLLGGIPRTPVFSPLTGQDYQQMAAYFDYIFPKHYYWHPEPDFGAAEWLLISSLCGKAWDEDPKGYWPTGTDKPDAYNGGRPVPEEI